VHWKVEFDDILAKHLKHCKGNATYTSPDIQNKLIALCGLEIRDRILEEVRSVQFYSVMADECTDVSTKKQMSICVTFVNENNSYSPRRISRFC